MVKNGDASGASGVAFWFSFLSTPEIYTISTSGLHLRRQSDNRGRYRGPQGTWTEVRFQAPHFSGCNPPSPVSGVHWKIVLRRAWKEGAFVETEIMRGIPILLSICSKLLNTDPRLMSLASTGFHLISDHSLLRPQPIPRTFSAPSPLTDGILVVDGKKLHISKPVSFTCEISNGVIYYWIVTKITGCNSNELKNCIGWRYRENIKPSETNDDED